MKLIIEKIMKMCFFKQSKKTVFFVKTMKSINQIFLEQYIFFLKEFNKNLSNQLNLANNSSEILPNDWRISIEDNV